MKLPRLPLILAGFALGAGSMTAAVVPVQDLHFALEHMDRTVSPGTNFPKFAWGAWGAKTEIPSDKASWGSFAMLAQNNWARIRGILEEAATNPGQPGSKTQKVGDFYASAMD